MTIPQAIQTGFIMTLFAAAFAASIGAMIGAIRNSEEQ